MRSCWLILLAVVVLAGCTVGPDYHRPSLDLPQAGPDSTHLSDAQEQALAYWWTRFRDPVLNRLIDRALDRNLSIALQAQRVRQARAELGLANANLYPTVEGQANAMREKSSRAAGRGASGGGQSGGGAPAPGGSRYNYFSVAATLDYELDVFGGLRRADQAARARLLSSVYTQDSIRLSVVSDVVTNYMSLRALQRQIRVTKKTIQTRSKGLALDRKRYQYGAIDQLTLLQAKSLLQTARAQLPPLEEQEAKLRTSLAILTGKTPRQIMADTAVAVGSFKDITLPRKLPAVLPSQLVDRRPDVRAAEANLIAANANVGVAKAQFFPSFNLSAMLGTQALTVDDLFKPASEVQKISGLVTVPILDFGATNARYHSAKAQKQAAVISYRQTLRQAFKEVQDALSEIKYSNRHLHAVQSQLQAYQQSLRLARIRYQAGQSNYFDVLDAERHVFSSQFDLTNAIRDRFTATADLFKALGGGWPDRHEAPAAAGTAVADSHGHKHAGAPVNALRQGVSE